MNKQKKLKIIKNSSKYILKSYKFLCKEYNNEDILIVGDSKDCEIMKSIIEKISLCSQNKTEVRNILVLKKNFEESFKLIKNEGKKFGLILFDINSKQNLKSVFEKIKLLRLYFQSAILLTENYELLQKVKSNLEIFVQTNGILIKHTNSFGRNLGKILKELLTGDNLGGDSPTKRI